MCRRLVEPYRRIEKIGGARSRLRSRRVERPRCDPARRDESRCRELALLNQSLIDVDRRAVEDVWPGMARGLHGLRELDQSTAFFRGMRRGALSIETACRHSGPPARAEVRFDAPQCRDVLDRLVLEDGVERGRRRDAADSGGPTLTTSRAQVAYLTRSPPVSSCSLRTRFGPLAEAHHGRANRLVFQCPRQSPITRSLSLL